MYTISRVSIYKKNIVSVLIFLILCSVCISFPNTSSAQNKKINNLKLIEIGKRIYQQGILANGTPLLGVSAGEVTLSGSTVSCIRCHRRSGFGSTEGNLRISPILGDILYNERNKSDKELGRRRTKGHGARPAYTDLTLKNAITIGTGADNRKLNVLMPRYKLIDSDVNAIIAYLKSLTIKTDGGITKENINIATIITSDVSDSRSKAIQDLLEIYFKDVNAKTRQEHKRATNSPWHKRWEYESYRNVKLHVWKLTGLPSTWNQQLQSYYKTQNVFAVINGVSNQPWTEVDKFCNKIKLPCLFPTIELPVLNSNNIYNFYFSGGIEYDAKTIAAHLSRMPTVTKKTVLQVYRADIKSKTAATVIKHDLEKNNISVKDYIVSSKKSLTADQWSQIISNNKPEIVISWLDSDDVKALNSKTVKNNAVERFYYSYSHIGEDYTTIIKSNTKKSYVVYRNMLPKRLKLHMTRATVWAKRKKIDISDEKVIGNAFFVATLFNRSVKRMRAYLKQDYLLDMVEVMLENNAFQSVYPNLSLGPDQRIASKGAYILGPLSNSDVNNKENHVWIRH